MNSTMWFLTRAAAAIQENFAENSGRGQETEQFGGYGNGIRRALFARHLSCVVGE